MIIFSFVLLTTASDLTIVCFSRPLTYLPQKIRVFQVELLKAYFEIHKSAEKSNFTAIMEHLKIVNEGTNNLQENFSSFANTIK